VTAAVFFDVDFTLIYPGPTFRGEGYRRFGERHGLVLDESKFEDAVRAAAPILDAAQGDIYDPAIFHQYTAAIIEAMGGSGPAVHPCAVEVYEEWALHHHFEMYDDVPDVMRAIAAQGIKIGLISNSHRPLTSFQSHFELEGLVSATLSSSDHGYLKPHPSIFNAALQLLGVEPQDSVMVGDSLGQDVAGALAVGMRAVLVRRGPGNQPFPSGRDEIDGVPVIHSLHELLPLL
jgi:HAD superfamily hydrolase (TIGR01662 family)